MTPGKMFWEGVWVGDFVPEIVSNRFPCFRLSPGFLFFSPLCFTALTCHLAFLGGGVWGEMTLAGEPVPKSSQHWQSEAERGNKSTWMEEIDFSRVFFPRFPGISSYHAGGYFFSRLSSSLGTPSPSIHSLYTLAVRCDIIRDWFQTKTKFCSFNFGATNAG